MSEGLILSAVVDWSRMQFALTAMFHWLFVPLTLGLSFIIAIMETIYYRTGNEFWKNTTRFWMKIFGINFAIGVATGIILEFEFGNNWSNYSWFVGDIFGAPLAIEGILAFFMESTFVAVMFFGWNKVSKKFHLVSTWLTAIGASLSALWILVANAWMQYPVGMVFNPDTARNEMASFWEVLFSPFAMNKFFHTITSAFLFSAVIVVGISAWYLLKKRHIEFATKSIKIAAIFGLFGALTVSFTGHGSAYQVAQKQPMKLAAMEGLYDGEKGAGLSLIGFIAGDKLYDIKLPKALSLLGYNSLDAFVPGVNDIIKGGYEYTDADGNVQIALSVEEKMRRGQIAKESLADYINAEDATTKSEALKSFREHEKFFGYGHFDTPTEIVPNIPINYYAFRIMVGIGSLLMLLMAVMLFLNYKKKLVNSRFVLKLAVIAVPFAYIVSEAGWVVAELGRQPWAIQDLLPTKTAVSHISAGSVMVTFFLFFSLFLILLIAELMIMFKQIKKGPENL